MSPVSDRLRERVASLPTTEESRRWVMETGCRLGLPEDWLSALPEVGMLPGDYHRGDRYGDDAALTWASQELLARTGRLAECDPLLVAEALEGESGDDGRGWLHKEVEKTLFLLTWPVRTYSAHVRIQMSAEGIVGCLASSPSAAVFPVVASAWRSAADDIRMLNPDLEPPDVCPWPDLSAVLIAAADRIDEGADMERRRCRGEPLPDEYRAFLR